MDFGTEVLFCSVLSKLVLFWRVIGVQIGGGGGGDSCAPFDIIAAKRFIFFNSLLRNRSLPVIILRHRLCERAAS